MKVIRDDELLGFGMIPLFVDWNVRRCNMKDCTNRPSTILTDVHPEVSLAGLCEPHYQEFLQEDGSCQFEGTMTFDDFDAFKATPVAKANE